MRPSHSVFISLFISALFLAGCSNFGSPTGLASNEDSPFVGDKIPSSDSLTAAVANTTVPPASDTGNPVVAPADPVVATPNPDSADTVVVAPDAPVEDTAQSPANPVVDVPNPDSADPVVATPEPDSTPVAAVPVPDTTTPVAAVPVPDTTTPVAVIPTPEPTTPVVVAPNPDTAQPPTNPVVVVPNPDPVRPDPVLPDPVQPAIIPAANPALSSKVFLNTDFESESLECWNSNRTATTSNGAGCGQFKSIGFAPFALGQNGITHSGSKAIDITYSKNEEMGGTNVGISADSVNVRAWYYFEPGFDFGQGMKIGRVSSFNNARQLNDVDIILEVRSSGGKNQCGVTDMADIGLFFNGAPKGYDWGNAAANISFQRGRWYAVEYQVVLNNPGRSDGAVRLWVDGQQVAARTGLNIRGTAGMDSKLNTVKIGGWYSNAANGNSCTNPSQPSKLHMDDVAIATSYIGLGAPNSVAAR